MITTRKVAAVGFALTMILSSGPSAWADDPSPAPSGAETQEEELDKEGDAWRVRPNAAADGASRNYFVVKAEPGASIADVMVVENLSERAQTLEIYGQEAVLTPDGKYSAPPGRAAEGSFGEWIVPTKETVTLEPLKSAEIPFTISVPAGATPGDYDGAIFTARQAPTVQDGEQMVLDLRVGVRIHLRVLGEVAPSLEVSNVTAVRLAPWWNPLPASTGMSFTVTNAGNVRVTAKATAEVVADYIFRKDRRTAMTSAMTPELLPGSSAVFSAESVETSGAWAQGPVFAGLWEFGKQTYTVYLVNGQVPESDITAPTAKVTIEVWRIPWIPAALAAFILLLIIRGLLRLIFRKSLARRRRRRDALQEWKRQVKSAKKRGVAPPPKPAAAMKKPPEAGPEAKPDEVVPAAKPEPPAAKPPEAAPATAAPAEAKTGGEPEAAPPEIPPTRARGRHAADVQAEPEGPPATSPEAAPGTPPENLPAVPPEVPPATPPEAAPVVPPKDPPAVPPKDPPVAPSEATPPEAAPIIPPTTSPEAPPGTPPATSPEAPPEPQP
jgi:hypothetical protein